MYNFNQDFRIFKKLLISEEKNARLLQTMLWLYIFCGKSASKYVVIFKNYLLNYKIFLGERSGSVVECFTRD